MEFDSFVMRYGFDANKSQYGEWIEAQKHQRYHNTGVSTPGRPGQIRFNEFWNEPVAWWHGDMKDVAYTFVFPLFDAWVVRKSKVKKIY